MKLSSCRITKARHASVAFSGEGARVTGGRWNSPGIPVVYTAGTASLAMLEMLVHLHSRDLLQRYVLFTATFDQKWVETNDLRRLPRNWRDSPSPASLRAIGDDWVVRADAPVLRVPSVVVPTEWNYLFNPAHPQFNRIDIGARTPVKFDQRLTERGGTPPG